jgi:pyruvate/2-oxoacid:ferredoxin oxidoreductase alpha subunit
MEFCGMVGYYRRFARGLADLETPLRVLTLKDAPKVWTTEHQEAFDGIKKAFSSAPVLAHPDFSLMDSFIISTDTSKVGIGAVHSQVGHE